MWCPKGGAAVPANVPFREIPVVSETEKGRSLDPVLFFSSAASFIPLIPDSHAGSGGGHLFKAFDAHEAGCPGV